MFHSPGDELWLLKGGDTVPSMPHLMQRFSKASILCEALFSIPGIQWRVENEKQNRHTPAGSMYSIGNPNQQVTDKQSVLCDTMKTKMLLIRSLV